MRHLTQFIALLLIPWSALAGDAPFEIRRVVEENTPGAVKAAYQMGEETRTLYLEETPALTVEHLAKAATKKGQAPQTYIEMELTPAGIKLVSDLTTNWLGKMVAILANGKVLTAPVIKSQITSGSLVIDGNFSKEEAESIVEALNKAAANVPLK